MKHIIAFLCLITLLNINLFSQDHPSRIDNKQEYDLLSGAPLANKYGSVTAVKVLYDIKNDSLYYLNSKTYKNHYEFCKTQLDYKAGMGNFLKRNYSNGPQRLYLLANVNYFHSNDKYVLDLSPIDLMTKNQIVNIFEMVKNSSFTNNKLYFLLNSPRLKKLDDSLQLSIKTISPSEIYGDLTYQAVSKYQNTGVLRVVDDINSVNTPIKPTDVIILKNIPNYLPAVAGVIVTEFQTPLSHISILGLNRKIPICAYTKAFENKNIMDYVGKQIHFSVKSDTFYIKNDSSSLIKKNAPKIKLLRDITINKLVDVSNLNENSSRYVGGKASNFGVLDSLSKTNKFKTPEGAFAIPFYFYVEHLKKSKADKIVRKLTKKKNISIKKKDRLLTLIDKKIKEKEINPILIQSIKDKCNNGLGFTKYRFRSSTNAEDIKGFSGAGLYTSKSAKVNSSESIEKAIKKVWCSVWSEKAFNEREYFNINQQNVAMGILVHRSFPSEKVNGVALTKNIYRSNSNAFLINAQLGNESVVEPKKGVVCDQFLCFPSKSNAIYNDKVVIDVITYSNINNNKLVMTNSEIQNLANQLDIIKRYFAGDIGKWSYTRLGFDIEFKLDGEDRQLYIKQVRPYND